MNDSINNLMKALEAGSYATAPQNLSQGASLQIEDLSPVMQNVTFQDKHLRMQKSLGVKDAKGTLIQFNRQLSYGIFGGSAQYEGGIGEEDTSDLNRAVVPMSYYSTVRRVTVAANYVSPFDGIKAEDRSSDDGTKKIAGDIEFDIFQGQAHYSNAGIFDGNPLAIAKMPNMLGMDQQIRESDNDSNTQDLMFAEYGSSLTVVLPINGVLAQSNIEDAGVRSAMNLGAASDLHIDPISLAEYNKIAFPKERIMLAGAPQEATGANLRTQWTSSGAIAFEPSRFLSGKTQPARSRNGAPSAPGVMTPSALIGAGSLLAAGTYQYFVTAASIVGESAISPVASATVATNGDGVSLTWAPVSGAAYYNMYRTNAGGAAPQSAFFIGRIRQGNTAPVFIDLGNRSPGFANAYLLEKDTMSLYQLAPFSSLKLAVSDLSIPQALYRFLCLAVYQPRKDVVLDNLSAQLSGYIGS